MPQSYWSSTTNRIEESQDLFNQNDLRFLVVNRNQTFTYHDLFVTGTPSSMSFEKPVKPENRAESGRIMIRHFQNNFFGDGFQLKSQIQNYFCSLFDDSLDFNRYSLRSNVSSTFGYIWWSVTTTLLVWRLRSQYCRVICVLHIFPPTFYYEPTTSWPTKQSKNTTCLVQGFHLEVAMSKKVRFLPDSLVKPGLILGNSKLKCLPPRRGELAENCESRWFNIRITTVQKACHFFELYKWIPTLFNAWHRDAYMNTCMHAASRDMIMIAFIL